MACVYSVTLLEFVGVLIVEALCLLVCNAYGGDDLISCVVDEKSVLQLCQLCLIFGLCLEEISSCIL